METPQAHCQTQHCEDFWEWFPETNFVFNFVDQGKKLHQLWRGLRFYVATIGIVMSNKLSIYVATAGIDMSHMPATV